jgi:hypothetical protein
MINPKKHKDLLKKKNVVAVARGEKWSNGKNTGEEALLVFVEKKISKDKLKPGDMIPKSVGGVQTDVVGRSDKLKALGVLTSKQRPIPGGYSCGHARITAGTIGGWFIDKDGELVGLSNNHVLANENNAKSSGDWTWIGRGRRRKRIKSAGSPIVQPGPYDDRWWRRNKNKVGNLKDFVKLVRQDNLQDSAVFKPDSVVLADSEMFRVGQLNGFRDNLQIGEQVQKVGRTTGYTTGKVIALDGVVNVQYGRKLGVIEFEDQIITDFMSEGGDSGSLLLDMNNNVVGLLYAGSSTVTLHNKIKYPRERYGLKIYNPNPLTETYAETLTVDGVDEVSADLGDLNALVARARRLAKQGKNVQINISLNLSLE